MFQLLERPPRMLPRIFNPVQLNVDCSAKTPMKEPDPKKAKRGKAGKSSGGSRARPSSGSGKQSSAAGQSRLNTQGASVISVQKPLLIP